MSSYRDFGASVISSFYNLSAKLSYTVDWLETLYLMVLAVSSNSHKSEKLFFTAITAKLLVKYFAHSNVI